MTPPPPLTVGEEGEEEGQGEPPERHVDDDDGEDEEEEEEEEPRLKYSRLVRTAPRQRPSRLNTVACLPRDAPPPFPPHSV